MANTNRHNGDKADWADVLGLLDDRPSPEWKTATELAEELNISERAARERLLNAVKAGKVERERFRNGGVASYYYRPK